MSAEEPSTNPSTFPVGAKVILQNLSAAEFNGKIGVVKSSLENERQQVLLIQSGKRLGIKPVNLRYEPRTVNSLTISEIKTLLSLKEVTNVTGYDKSQLREMLKIKYDSDEVLIAAYLYTQQEKETNAPKPAGGARGGNMMDNMTPEQLRQQARMMRTMPPAQLRRMNPQFAGMSDAQLAMAANQMEMMANNPDMFNQMKQQVAGMSPEELQKIQKEGMRGMNNGAPAAGQQMNVNDMSPEQMKRQAEMMKSMDKDTIRSMNPQMANWNDQQIDMAINQMEAMANNPDMMKQMKEQMKGMKPEDIEKMKKMAADGNLTGEQAAGGMPSSPMDMLNNADPAQLKNMLKMVKENPQLMKDMLRSSNPAMADNMSDEQLQKTIDAFAGMDEKKLGWVLKAIGWLQEFKNSSKAKLLAFGVLGMFVFVMGMLIYLVKSSGSVEDTGAGLGNADEVPPVPNMDSEF